MALHVIPELSGNDETTGLVVIESDAEGGAAIEELRSADARRMALQYGVKMGLSDPGVNNNVDPYPVDTEGNVVGFGTAAQVHRYRADISITRRLG